MELLLIRHADAGEHDPELYPNDDLRPISRKGRERQAAATLAMKARGIAIDHLLTSPLVRAVQTAEIVRKVYALGPEPRITDTLGHGCNAERVVKLLKQFAPDAHVAMVGHEPSFSQVASELTGGKHFNLRKSGVIGVGFDADPRIGKGRLLYEIEPPKG